MGLTSWSMRSLIKEHPEIAQHVIEVLVASFVPPTPDSTIDGRRTSDAEVFGADVLDEVLELVDDLVGVLLGLGRGFLADGVDEFVARVDRRFTAHRQRDRIGRPSRDHRARRRGLQVDLGEVRAVADLGDDDARHRRRRARRGC